MFLFINFKCKCSIALMHLERGVSWSDLCKKLRSLTTFLAFSRCCYHASQPCQLAHLTALPSKSSQWRRVHCLPATRPCARASWREYDGHMGHQHRLQRPQHADRQVDDDQAWPKWRRQCAAAINHVLRAAYPRPHLQGRQTICKLLKLLPKKILNR